MSLMFGAVHRSRTCMRCYMLPVPSGPSTLAESTAQQACASGFLATCACTSCPVWTEISKERRSTCCESRQCWWGEKVTCSLYLAPQQFPARLGNLQTGSIPKLLAAPMRSTSTGTLCHYALTLLASGPALQETIMLLAQAQVISLPARCFMLLPAGPRQAHRWRGTALSLAHAERLTSRLMSMLQPAGPRQAHRWQLRAHPLLLLASQRAERRDRPQLLQLLRLH